MSVGFGFSVGDFIAAIDLCTKVAKALKDSGAAAAEYQQVVVELQGLQNVLTRLAALRPTESNAQHVNAIRAAALASTLSLQGVLSKLEKFEHSMSPFAAKKPFAMSRATRQTQYALFMADEIRKMRAVIYGNVIRINVLLAFHASETLSRTEEQLSHHHQHLVERFKETKRDMSQLIKDVAQIKTQTATQQKEAQQDKSGTTRQSQEPSDRVAVDSTATASQPSSSPGIWDLSSQALSLLRSIPAELGDLIQSVIRSNARIESTLLNLDQKIADSPTLSLNTNIQLEDALGRVHTNIPFEWFQYWETFEGLLKARFKDVPGYQKIEKGDYRLVHAKRPSISLNKDSWSGSISPGAQIVMLMMVTNVALLDFSCPRRSCAGKIPSKATSVSLMTCPECGLRFIPQPTSAGEFEAEEVFKLQRIEDSKLFGKDPNRPVSKDLSLSNRLVDVTEDSEVTDVPSDGEADTPTRPIKRQKHSDSTPVSPYTDSGELMGSHLRSPQSSETPIISWLSKTVPPNNPDSIHEWRDTTEAEFCELKEREAQDLEVFHNVQIVVPREVGKPELTEPYVAYSGENDLESGARIYYRNILDRFPLIDLFFARRLAMCNLQRLKHLAAQRSVVERIQTRPKPWSMKLDSAKYQKAVHFENQPLDLVDKTDDWEDIDPVIERLVRGRADSPHPNHPLVQDGGLGDSHAVVSAVGDSLAWCQGWLVNPSRAVASMKEKRFCRLPPIPLPLPIADASTTTSSMLCYLCHLQVQIPTKQSWRTHVMYDLRPYICPLGDCKDVGVMFPRRTNLSQHIRKEHDEVLKEESEVLPCPFCNTTELSGSMKKGARPYIKHIGHHMEEIAFSVVSTAYENWSYDESSSEIEYHNNWKDFTMVTQDTGLPNVPWQDPRDEEPADEDTQYEDNYWTGKKTAASSGSSANSALRDPYSASYLRKGSASSKKAAKKRENDSKAEQSGEKRVGRRKGPLRPEQRKQAQNIRALRSCLRCKFLKKVCDPGEPCKGCQPSPARLWQIPCTRMAIKDLGSFLQNWKAAYGGQLSMAAAILNETRISDEEFPILITHGYGPILSISTREVNLKGNGAFRVEWTETTEFEPGVLRRQQFEVDTANLCVGRRGIFILHMARYIDSHIDAYFENFVEQRFERRPFLTETLKTVHRYFHKDRSDILRKALRLMVAYHLTHDLMMLSETGASENKAGRIQHLDSKFQGKIAAPGIVSSQIASWLMDYWVDIHQELLESLDSYYSSVYKGRKWKDWHEILFITLVILAIWEDMQFDWQRREMGDVGNFCKEMEETPVAVLIGLFHMISTKMPRFQDWNTLKHGQMYFPGHAAFHEAMSEMRTHVIKYESYLRSRSAEAKFDGHNPHSLSNKFLAKLVLQEKPT